MTKTKKATGPVHRFVERYIPLEVSAEAFDPKHPHVSVAMDDGDDDCNTGIIHTSSGEQLKVQLGDMIVTYPDGQVKPMKADLFNATFEPATETSTHAPALPASTDS